MLVAQWCPTLWDLWTVPGSSAHGILQAQNTGVGGHFLLHGIFLTLGSNPGLLHPRQIFNRLSHQGSPVQSYKDIPLWSLFFRPTSSRQLMVAVTTRTQAVGWVNPRPFPHFTFVSEFFPCWPTMASSVSSETEVERAISCRWHEESLGRN